MTNKQKIKRHHTVYGKLVKKTIACKEKRKVFQAMKKSVRQLLAEDSV